MHLLLLFTLFGFSLANSCPDFTPKANFKIKRYTGFWYEVARLPSQFQTGTKCDNATYTLNSNGTVTVFNQAITAQGQYTSIRGLATVINPDAPASLRIVFGTGQEGGYNVLRTDYKNYAAVYSCRFFPSIGANVEFGFILSRNKMLSSNTMKKAEKAFTDIVVNVTKFVSTPQNC